MSILKGYYEDLIISRLQPGIQQASFTYQILLLTGIMKICFLILTYFPSKQWTVFLKNVLTSFHCHFFQSFTFMFKLRTELFYFLNFISSLARFQLFQEMLCSGSCLGKTFLFFIGQSSTRNMPGKFCSEFIFLKACQKYMGFHVHSKYKSKNS